MKLETLVESHNIVKRFGQIFQIWVIYLLPKKRIYFIQKKKKNEYRKRIREPLAF